MTTRVLLVLLLSGCSPRAEAPLPQWPQEGTRLPSPPPSTPSADVALGSEGALPELSCGARPKTLGKLQSTELDEVSGMVSSRSSPGVYFVHNDSGDTPRFFAIDAHGRELAEYHLPIQWVLDVEEIAIGPGPGTGTYLYLGDIGNNHARTGKGIPRDQVVIYRLPEPHVTLPIAASSNAAADRPMGGTTAGTSKTTITSTPAPQRIELTYPDRPHDCEAMFVDPRSGDLFLITKEDDGASSVLQATAAQLARGEVRLQLVTKLQFGSLATPSEALVTAADISPHGDAILVRTYASVYLYRRGPEQTVAQALAAPARHLPGPPEPQGESITFTADARSYLTVSEGVGADIHCTALP